MMRIRFFAFLVVTMLCMTAVNTYGQSTANKQVSADALVKDLYKVHTQKRGPFYQTKSRALLYKYFEKSLADMIWKDRVTSKGEVGALDGDPLYDAQDFDIKNFAIGKAEYEGTKARVPVTFENIGEKKSLVFLLGKGTTGWRINDIDYGQDRTLRGFFKKGK
ncbi:MAG TPA: DUF3828 domain-containing protein [Pyrinomonadaceae bacterium]|nr:DUF3828 domain-containing protein [Pyrinomonadaceae bacterium]